ncbi:Outer membrane protein beta-barrel domain-containing protein [Spirosomataceae bacterium TFI 002]|nr:Outer membrane protein beta-barrel domain-containing protein [Spirosomataceae bacterium TFI 002]
MKKILIILLTSNFTFAQEGPLEMKSNTEGFSVGVNFNSLGWSSDYFTLLDDQESNGVGVGVELGYGITQRFEVIGRFDFSTLALENEWDYFTMGNAELMARFNPGATTKKFRPYVELGVGNQGVSVSPIFFNNQQVEYAFSGIGFAYGAGLNFFLNRNLLITANLAGSTGNMSSFTINGVGGIEDVPDVSNFRIRIGGRFYFKDL